MLAQVRPCLGFNAQHQNQRGRKKHFRSKHSRSSLNLLTKSSAASVEESLQKATGDVWRKQFHFLGRDSRATCPRALGYMHMAFIFIKKKKNTNRKLPFLRPPTVLPSRIYQSCQTQIYLCPTQTSLLSCDGYCKLLTSAKPCQETEVIENSRAVGEHASRMISGFSSSFGRVHTSLSHG